MEAGVRCYLAWGEADAAYSDGEGLTATCGGAEEGLLGHFAEASDDRHGIC